MRPSEPEPSSYTRAVSRGAGWVTVTLAVGRVSSFIANLVLGWILAPAEFATIAIAMSAAAVVAALRDGGAIRFLVQSNTDYERWAPAVFRIALAFNIVGALLLVAIAIPVARFYNVSAVAPVMALTALSLPLSTPGAVLRARLQGALRFSDIARIDSLSLLLRYSTTVLAALAGLGALSFAVAAVAAAMFDWWRYASLAGGVPTRGDVSSEEMRAVIAASAWGMATNLAISVTTQGDYLVIGRMISPEMLAFYYFGFQLAGTVSMLFSSTIRSVLLPAYSRLGTDTSRQGAAFLKSVRLLAMTAAPACGLLALTAGPMIRFLWQGKWDGAIPVAEIIGASVMFRLLTPLTGTLLESRGAWRKRAYFQAIDGATVLLAAYVGASRGSLITIALCVAGSRAVVGSLQALYAANLVGVGKTTMSRAILAPAVAAGLCAFIAVAVGGWVTSSWHWLARLALHVLVFTLAYTLVAVWIMRPAVGELRDVIRQFRRRSDQIAAVITA